MCPPCGSNGFSDIGRTLDNGDPGGLQRGEFFNGGALASGNDRSGMAHALLFWRHPAGDEGEHRLGHVRLDVGRRLFLFGAADFADEHDRLGLRVLLEQPEQIHKS